MPNSLRNKFRPDTADSPYELADKTVSRKSYFYHEGSSSEYEQPRNLYKKVIDSTAQDQLHLNTAIALKRVDYPPIQKKYLAQLFRISQLYTEKVFNMLPEKNFSFTEVEEAS
jgi:catalase